MRTLSSILFIVVQLLCTTTINMAQEVSLSKPGCPENCGNVTVPYPFGIGPECSANAAFAVVCNYTTNPPKPYLDQLKLEALEFSIETKTVRVTQGVFPLSCNSTRRVILVGQILSTPFRYSVVYNSLVVVGCRNSVFLLDFGPNPAFGGCAPICGGNMPSCKGRNCCNGMNCCQTTIPSQFLEPEIFYTSGRHNASVCGYAFISDHRWLASDYVNYIGNTSNFPDPVNMSFGAVPMVLEWDFNVTKEDLKWPIECANMSVSTSPWLDDDLVNTTQCYCVAGFRGNPYLPGGGCYDIDECSSTTLNTCIPGSTCVNTHGSYTCVYPDQTNKMKSTVIGVSSATGALLLLASFWMSSKLVRKKVEANRKMRFFKRNGGLLLQQQLSSGDGGVDNIKVFSARELALATDRYNENRVIGRGGQGTVYKGMLPDGRIVAVKKSKKVEEGDIEVFINEVVILSQINHRNIVKVLGCCLETEVPLLVYEFIPNGTLFDHIHDHEFPLSWKMRVRIATEVAGALSYLHYSASVPIYHRDIKSTNILLDDKYRAKVSDFGTSRSITIDQTHATTRVMGTIGYLDPEYFQSSQFTEKSDVYSFGVVVVELLTGEKAISAVRETGKSLATHFLHSMEEDKLFDIVDQDVVREGRSEEIVAIAELAMRCLNLDGKKRPTMKEATAVLEGIQMGKEGSVLQYSKNEENMFHSVEIFGDSDFPIASATNTSTLNTMSPLLHF